MTGNLRASTRYPGRAPEYLSCVPGQVFGCGWWLARLRPAQGPSNPQKPRSKIWTMALWKSASNSSLPVLGGSPVTGEAYLASSRLD